MIEHVFIHQRGSFLKQKQAIPECSSPGMNFESSILCPDSSHATYVLVLPITNSTCLKTYGGVSVYLVTSRAMLPVQQAGGPENIKACKANQATSAQKYSDCFRFILSVLLTLNYSLPSCVILAPITSFGHSIIQSFLFIGLSFCNMIHEDNYQQFLQLFVRWPDPCLNACFLCTPLTWA